MSFGSFIRGIVAQVNPFDNGKTYGSYNPPGKKKPDDQPSQRTNAPQPIQPGVSNDPGTLAVQRPENLFAGLNNNLRLPGSQPNNISVVHAPNLTSLTPPNPGTVVQPNKPPQPPAGPKPGWTGPAIGTHAVVAGTPGTYTQNGFVPDKKPQSPGFLDHVGNALKVAGQTAVGTVANVPEVVLGAGRAASGLVQGAAHLPSLATHALTYVPRKIAGDDSGVNTALSNVNHAVDTATSVVDKPFNFVNRNLDRAATNYASVVPMAAAGANVYRREQVPLNILAGLATLGGSTAAEAGNAGKLGTVSRFLDKPLTSNTDNIVARSGQAVSNRAGPVVQPLMTPVRSARAGVNRLINGRTIPAADRAAVDAGEVGNVLSEPQLQELTAPPTQIPVTQRGGGDVPVPVGVPRPGAPIRELGGDTPGVVRIPTPQEAATQKAANRFSSQPPGRPDQNIEGVTPRVTEPFKLPSSAVKSSQDDLVSQYADFLRNIGEGNGVAITSDGRRVSNNVRFGETGGKRMTKAAWRDEAQRQLDAGQAEPGLQKSFNDAANPDVQSLLNKGEQPPVPEGRPIAVKEVKGIPVQDRTVVPQNLPETPGQVRPTVQTSPNDVKSEAVANAPVVASPAALPREVQAVLDNPKQFNKRQVTAARNQAKLAKKYAKSQEDIAAASSRADAAQPTPPTSAGFVPTGEFRQGANGNVSEVAHQSTEAAQGAVDTATLNSGDVLSKASQEMTQGGRVSPESVRNLQAMLDSGRFAQTSPEYRAMAKTLYGAGSDYGRGLSLFNPTMRRTASGDQLTNRFVSKLYGVVEDGSKLTDSHIAAVSEADNTFAAARDAANQALDRYNGTKSAADFATWKQARQVADDAEKHSLITEYRVANDVLKGNKDPVALKAVQDAEKKAGVYQMDWIDANMLSGTGTATRNFVNTGLVRLENRLFGGRGYSSKGAKMGNAVGNRSVVSDFKARNELDQNVLSKSVKQWSTTANTLGEGNINAVGSARAYKFYEKQLKDQGVTGDQLKQDTEVMLHTDPQGMAERYNQWSLSENALSGLAHSKKIEQTLVEAIASKGGGKLSQTGAKALVRLTVGFPTVIGRSLVGGAKRATFGVPDLISAGKQFAKGDTQAMKDALYAAKVHAGSGATLYALGTGLAEAGLISPSYPSDPAEQARWKAEGTQPNSIKIGGQWFSIPGYFGALALPLVIPANVINKTGPGDIVKGLVSGVQDLAPTAGIVNFINGMEGRGGKQWLKNEATSLVRAGTPVGALLAEIAKMTDSTKNDTTTKDGISNLIDSIAGGIPGVNNAVNKIPATDDNGNVLHNPNPVAIAFGAQGTEQPQGKQDVQAAQSAANNTYKQLNDYGVLKDKELMSLVDKKIQAQIGRGQPLTPEQLTKVQKAVVKGVGGTGEDTAYLEKGQYDTNIAALKVKRDLLAADSTTKPSILKDFDTAIKRGGVYKDNKIPYDLISAYKSTSSADWHKMGIPPGDKNYDPDVYDPEMYQKLWNMDQLMTKAGVSYRKGHLDKNKYSDPNAKAKASGSGTKQLDTSFGQLKPGSAAPTVQQYQSIAAKSGTIPIIGIQTPNIVHKISAGGGI